MNKPKVSVIITVYNIEKYLAECIQSVIDQTFKDIQIIIVDDGSTDGSKTICEEFAKKDARIDLIRQENGGNTAARLKGASMVRGEYLLYVDGDDFIAPDMVQKLYEKAESEGAEVVITACYRYFEDGSKEFFGSKLKPTYTQEEIKSELLPDIVPGSANEKFSPNLWTKLIKTDIYNENLAKYVDKKLTMGEDVIMCLPPIIKASKIAYIDEGLYFYRQTQTQMSAKYRESFFDSEFLVRECMKKIGDDIGYDFTSQLDRRYVNYSFWQLKFATKEMTDKEKLKKAFDKWCSPFDSKKVDRTGWTFKEKLKLFLMKHRLFAIIKII